VRIQERLETVQSRRRAASGALDRLSLGVFFLDARGRVVEMNSAAKKIVDIKDGLTLDRGTLVAIDTRAEVQLQRLIFGAAAAESGRILELGGAFSLPRASGRHPLSAMVAPTGATGLFPGSRTASVVLLVEEPVRRQTAPVRRVHRELRSEPRGSLAHGPARRRYVGAASRDSRRHPAEHCAQPPEEDLREDGGAPSVGPRAPCPDVRPGPRWAGVNDRRREKIVRDHSFEV
jgi:PAS domain-containing protein